MAILGRVLLAVSAFLLAAGLMTPACASDSQGEFSFWVKVENVERNADGVLSLKGTVLDIPMRIAIGNSATIQYASGTTANADCITAGSLIQVKAEWSQEGLVAKTISLTDPEEVAVTGVVERVEGNRFVVANLEFEISPGASLDGMPQEGDLVLARGIFLSDGIVHLSALEKQSGVQVKGLITTVDVTKSTITVNDKMVQISNKTVIKGPGEKDLTIRDLNIGQYVHVFGEAAKDGVVAATKILVFDTKMVLVEGVVTEYNAGASIKIKAGNSDLVLLIDKKTVIEGKIEVGATVVAEASITDKGGLLASRITVKKPEIILIEVHGDITTISTSPKYFLLGDTKVVVNDDTKYFDKSGTTSFDKLKVGDRVDVFGTRQTDGSILAAKVIVLPPVVKMVNVHGTVSGLDTVAKIFKVGDVSIKVNDETKLLFTDGRKVFGDLKNGDRVEVLGIQQQGNVLALTVWVLPNIAKTIELQGAISGLTVKSPAGYVGSFQLQAKTVLVDKKTVISMNNKIIGFDALKNGDRVAVVGTQQQNGVLALKITGLTSEQPKVEIHGTVSDVDPNKKWFTVEKSIIYVNDKTDIRYKGKSFPVADLKGKVVNVLCVKQSDGTLLALKVTVHW